MMEILLIEFVRRVLKFTSFNLGSEDNSDLKLEHSSLAWGLAKTGCRRLH